MEPAVFEIVGWYQKLITSFLLLPNDSREF